MRQFSFPSCSSDRAVQISDISATHPPISSTSTFLSHLSSLRSFLISITWTKSPSSRAFSLLIETLAGDLIWRVEVKPWLLSKNKGSKTLVHAAEGKIEVFWDLSAAKFGGAADPTANFFIAVVFKLEMALLLGDCSREAYRRSGAVKSCVSSAAIFRRVELSGKKTFSTFARFSMAGKLHEISIECKAAAEMEIMVDGRTAVRVEKLGWKFRGNQTIIVDGAAVEVYWDVMAWLFGGGAAVFVFWCSAAADKKVASPEKKGEPSEGFSLVLHAWRTE